MLYRNVMLLLLTGSIGTCYGMEPRHKALKTTLSRQPIQLNDLEKQQWIMDIIEEGEVDKLTYIFLHYDNQSIIDIVNDKFSLINAAKRGYEEIVRFLLEKGADSCVDASNEEFPTPLINNVPLHHAVDRGHEGITRWLLQYNAHTDFKPAPLVTACGRGYEHIVHLLLQHDTNPDRTNNLGYTSLHIVSGSGRERAVRLLLEYGANPNICTKIGKRRGPPLTTAAIQGNEHIVRLLLQYNATPTIIEDEHKTPLRWASFHGHKNIAFILQLFMQGGPEHCVQAVHNTTDYAEAISYINMALGQSLRDSTYYEAAQEMYKAALKIHSDHAQEIRANVLLHVETLKSIYQSSGLIDAFIDNVIQPQKTDISSMLDVVAHRAQHNMIAVPTFVHIIEQYGGGIAHQLPQPYAMLYRICYPEDTQQMLYDFGQRLQNRMTIPIEMQYAFYKHFDAMCKFRDDQNNTFFHYLAHIPRYVTYVKNMLFALSPGYNMMNINRIRPIAIAQKTSNTECECVMSVHSAFEQGEHLPYEKLAQKSLPPHILGYVFAFLSDASQPARQDT